VTCVDPAVTVAVSVTTVPELTVEAGAPADVIAKAVVVAVCAWIVDAKAAKARMKARVRRERATAERDRMATISLRARRGSVSGDCSAEGPEGKHITAPRLTTKTEEESLRSWGNDSTGAVFA